MYTVSAEERDSVRSLIPVVTRSYEEPNIDARN